jgi:flagellin
MTVINTNIKALYTQAALKLSERSGQAAMQQLSTGKRINSAKDDAAGLAIAARMTQQIKGLNQASRNAGDAISFIQTVDGASSEISNMLQRMSELAVQAANATYSDEQRGFLDLEFQQLKQEIERISEKYDWNGFKIMNGAAGAPIGPAPVTLTNPSASLLKDQLVINGESIRVPLSSDDPFSDTTAASSHPERSAIAIAAAINDSTSMTGVRAMPSGPVTSGTVTTVDTLDTGTVNLYINGTAVPITLHNDESPVTRRTNVINAINNTIANHGVTATDSGAGGISLTTKDGRNLSVWFDSTDHSHDTTPGTTLTAATFGLGVSGSPSSAQGVTGIASLDPTTAPPGATTLYGTVTLRSDTKPILVTDGLADPNNPLPLDIGSKDREGNAPAQTAGRMSFQVGPIADQVININLFDFGKNGTITGEITGDVDSTAPKVNIKTVEGANAVIDKLARTLDNVNAQRSTMGAVMNRLEHVIDNLNAVSMNTEASRSQIEDADYAKASTELARTQIMQQAATAVLAQANTSQQTVLKLLQG